MDQTTAQGILDRLDWLVRLTAAQLTTQGTNKEKVATLARAGLPTTVIGAILDMKTNVVNANISQLRKGGALP